MNPNFKRMMAVRAISTAALNEHQAQEARRAAYLASPEGIRAQRAARAEEAAFIREATALLVESERRQVERHPNRR